MHRKLIFIVLTLVFLAVSTPAMAYDSSARAALAIQEIMEYIKQNHIDKPELDSLAEGAINGMLGNLEDPYSEYLSPGNLNQYKELLDGDFVGVGLHLQNQNPYSLVVEVIPGSPAFRSEIKPGDFIVKVDGEDVAGLPLDALVEKIRGPEGTTVKLTVRRGAGELEVELERVAMSSPTVESARLNGNIGYVAIHSFGSRSAAEFSSALDGLVAAGVKGLILDMRDTPGGYLQAAVEIAGNFLKNQSLVVTIVNSDSSRDDYRSEGNPRWDGLPLVILMNSQSASSAEVLAGALQDYGKAILLGDTSYGKGVVQSIIPLESGGALKLTTARYLTPKGRSIDGVGLNPDVRVLNRELQLPAAMGLANPSGKWILRFKLNDEKVNINGEEISFYAQPYRSRGVAYVPFRMTVEALGYTVDWDHQKQIIEVQDGEGKIIFTPGKPEAIVNGSVAPMKTQIELKNGVSYFPLNAAHLLGATVVEQDNEITVIKNSRK